MKKNLADVLALIPDRQIRPAALSMVMLLALVLAIVLYLPYRQWQEANSMRLRMENQAANHVTMKQSVDQLIKEIAPLEKQLPLSSSPLDELVMSLMREVESLSSQHQLSLSAISPGTPSPFLMLNEVPISVELAGQYRNIVHWLHAVDRLSPSISLSQVSLKKGKREGDVVLNAVISAYQYRAEE